MEGKKAPADPLVPPAHQLWTDSHFSKPTASGAGVEESHVLNHPLYTPILKPYTGIGPLLKPLHWPEYDQSKQSNVKTGLPSPGAFNDFVFENPKDSPIGDYPRVQAQWTNIKDPFKYWDQQGRRNYGEIVYDHDNFTDQWGPGNSRYRVTGMNCEAIRTRISRRSDCCVRCIRVQPRWKR